MSDDNQNNKPIALQGSAVSSTKKEVMLGFTDNDDTSLKKAGYDTLKPESALMYAIKNATGAADKMAPRLAFTEKPSPDAYISALYKNKVNLLPDEAIKQVRITDGLIASILRTRSNMMKLFGHIRKDRFDIGIEISIKEEFSKLLNPEQFHKVKEKIKRLEQILLNCGHTEGLENTEKMTLAEYLSIQTYNGLSFGREAVEIIYDRTGQPDSDGLFPFHRFRPVDVGTINKAVRKGEYIAKNIREQAIKALESLTGEKPNIDMQKLREDQYAWVQVIEGQVRQAFTHDELLVLNHFPSTDVEHRGYPVSPLDTIISSVTTHISIDMYKKLYFQNGRATKGMLVIKSDEVDQNMLGNLKDEFNASINSVNNSFRTPIFGISKEDDVNWLPFAGEGARDNDFEFMYDGVARNIFAAFNMSPDEVPALGYLSRGTNSATLSESSNEFKVTAARDSGLRPLVLQFQTFFNSQLLPIIDPLLAKICIIRFAGLDAQDVDKENARLQQSTALFHGYDSLLKEVDKEPVGKAYGGDMPFNERFNLIMDKAMTMGQIKSKFFGDPSAILDPMLRYKRDPFDLQFVQLLAGINPNAVKAYFAPRSPELIKEIMMMEIQDEILDEE